MDTTRRGFRRRVAYEARPGRRAVVVPNLDELHGPVSGIVELPHRLFWQPERRIDLTNSALQQFMYETVLGEAVTVEELRTWLDGPTLIELWPVLFLPPGVRRAWEERHPTLRPHAIAA